MGWGKMSEIVSYRMMLLKIRHLIDKISNNKKIWPVDRGIATTTIIDGNNVYKIMVVSNQPRFTHIIHPYIDLWR